MTVLGYGTDRFPGFYLADSGFPVAWRVDTPAARWPRRACARASSARRRRSSSPTRSTSSSTRSCTTACCATGSRPPREQGVRGKDVTPFLLDRFHRETDGASLAANVRLVLRNAALAAQIAAPRHDARRPRRPDGRRRRALAGSARARQRHAGAQISVQGGGSAREHRGVARRARRATSRSSAASGDDDRGRAAVAELRGVDVRASVDPERPTGTCIVLVEPGGERTMLPDPGANDAPAARDDCPSRRPPARRRLRAAARRARARRAGGDRARPRGGDDRLRRPLVGGAAAPAARSRPVDLLLPNERRGGVLARRAAEMVVKLGASRGTLGRRRATCAGRAGARSSTPPAPATRSPPASSARASTAPSRARRSRRAAASPRARWRRWAHGPVGLTDSIRTGDLPNA